MSGRKRNRRSLPVAERLARLSELDDNGCLVWRGYINHNGYGTMAVNHKTVRAHRVAYEDARGPIPVDMVIDHLCRNRACINVNHLEVVTFAENVRRGALANPFWRIPPLNRNVGKTSCHRGHPFDDENTIWRKDGGRECRSFCRTRSELRRRAKKEKAS